MPRVKLDYVVSFSNEDSGNQASNLLAHEVSKKKWLCSEGEPTCSVVLQLARAVQIATVQVGAVHAALVEVLVGRSEKPNDQFEVLVPSSVFLSPSDSRRDSGVERVRSFSGDQLAAAREKRWDRVRVVCSQPYNKHCKYGLSFIHIFEPEDKNQPEPVQKAEAPAPAVPSRMMALDNYSSDEEDFRPGEMFAKHLQRISDVAGSSNTGAQIRLATSQALKNITDSSTKLVKTPIAKTSHNRPNQTIPTTNSNRQKDTLMYTDDDEQPHTKIDSIVQRHKDEKEQETKKKEHPKKDKQEPGTSRSFRDFIDDKEERRHMNNSRNKDNSKDDKHERRKDLNSSRSKEGSRDEKRRKDEERTPTPKKVDDSRQNKDKDSRKRPHPDEQQKEKEVLRAGPVSAAPHRLLADVVFALSGYENPRRARLRDAAVAMGARFQRDWSPSCTHLICAFSNTPKLKAVRAARAACAAVRGEWVEQCCARRRRLPWQWFAAEPALRVTPGDEGDEGGEGGEPRGASECDTDDEIEKVLRKQKKQRTDKSPSPRPQTSRDRSPQPHTSRQKSPNAHRSREKSPKPSTSREIFPKPSTSREKSPIPSTSKEISPRPRKQSPKSAKNMSNISSDSDVAFLKDERIQGNITLDSDSDETDEEKPVAKERVDKRSALPEFFDGLTFLVDDGVEEDGFEKDTLARYVRAYGGVVMDESQMDSESEVTYVLSTDASRKPASGQLVRPDWVWRCHEEKQLCDNTDYLL